MPKTVEQIAGTLNLSITTVRLVLNNKADQYRISLNTQKRILDYVVQHGYTVNHAARSLKLNKTDTLGLIIPRLSNLFFSTLAEKLELRCREAGFQLMLSCSYSDLPYEGKLVEALVRRNVDGLFIIPSSLESCNLHLKNLPKPVVFLDRDFGNQGAPLIVSDNSQGSALLTQAMLTASRQPLFFLAGDIHQPTIKHRLNGYRRVLAAMNIDAKDQWILSARHNRRMDGEQMIEDFLSRHTRPPAAFIASSLPVLEGALHTLRAKLGRIPPEINIGTFDEHAMLSFLPNRVWSVRQNVEAWVENAFNAMQKAIAGESPPVKTVVPMALIQRQVARAPEG
ncbi:LacI family DNA-binding transcriptional regulator [Martelella alba]|uniref:Substrate-binding domain-containing protein n=1 Tax=Martelella alba TaxID=2590451 RepID=A0ABY2SHA9_9HYPH|nr:LacI family DNA-binding transcriptional regulator [Martelella alba]TKI04672.1 substrate-binding domain-containing protein [Martelella alba]